MMVSDTIYQQQTTKTKTTTIIIIIVYTVKRDLIFARPAHNNGLPDTASIIIILPIYADDFFISLF